MKVFLSYRRADSAPWAGRLGDALAARYGSGNVFQDVVTIRPGEPYVDVMNTAVAYADVVLAVIGPGLLRPTDAGTPRLADPQDYVRRELVAAIAHARILIPVLVGGATLPSAQQLPDDLRPLVARQAVVLQDEDWAADVERLLNALGPEAAPRRRWRALAVAGAVVVLVVAGFVVAGFVASQLVGRGTGGAAGQSAQGGSAGTSSTDAPCATPAGEGWTAIGASAPTTSQGDWRFTVTGGGYRSLGSGGWNVVLALRGELVAGHSDYLYPYDYQLFPQARAPVRAASAFWGRTGSIPA